MTITFKNLYRDTAQSQQVNHPAVYQDLPKMGGKVEAVLDLGGDKQSGQEKNYRGIDTERRGNEGEEKQLECNYLQVTHTTSTLKKLISSPPEKLQRITDKQTKKRSFQNSSVPYCECQITCPLLSVPVSPHWLQMRAGFTLGEAQYMKVVNRMHPDKTALKSKDNIFLLCCYCFSRQHSKI